MEFEIGALCYEAIKDHLDNRSHYPEDITVGFSFNILKEVDNKDGLGLALVPFTVDVRVLNNNGFYNKSTGRFKITVDVEEVIDEPSDKDVSTSIV